MYAYKNIPNSIKSVNNWVCWRAVQDEKSHSGIKKIPINPMTDGQAMSNNPQTWSDFQTAVRTSEKHSGIGFMFSDSEFFGVDIDDCKDEIKRYKNGDKSGIIGEFIESLKSYAEVSQSGNGIHIICRGKLPEGARRKGKIEMYDSGRYFIMTGNKIGDYSEIVDCTESIKNLHEKYLSYQKNTKKSTAVPKKIELSEKEIVEKMCASSAKANALYHGDWSEYPSQSEADIAFCSCLAFWTGGDPELMDRIYRNSGLMRDKWDRKQSGSTYGKILILKCINECTEFYDPKKSAYKITVKNSKPIMRSLDDTGNSQRMMDVFGDILRYNYTDRRWIYYADGVWRYDDRGVVFGCADEILGRMKKESALWAEHENGAFFDDFKKHMKKTRSNASKRAMVREFEHLVPISPNELDSNKLLINCKNGTYNLEINQIEKHSPEKYITKMLGTSLPENPKKPVLWLNFLNEIFGGDAELICYVQKALGYSLTGLTTEQCVFFLYGTGRNGKSTFLEIVRLILGEYATNIQPESIMIKNTSNSANTDIARLKGARFVTSVEPNEGMRLNEGLIKQLTGDDMITARKLYGDEFEYRPEFKLWIATNHKPTIRGTDLGIWRRIHIIPFTVTIPEEKIDKRLSEKLTKELPDILAWIVEGYRLWVREGLCKPKVIEEAVKEYQTEMDVISAFLSSEYVVQGGECKASVLYAVYCQWCRECNEYIMSNSKFGKEIVKKFSKVRKNNGQFYIGISISGITISV